jgi:hypothetical protein
MGRPHVSTRGARRSALSEGGLPEAGFGWIPAFAGMTLRVKLVEQAYSGLTIVSLELAAPMWHL